MPLIGSHATVTGGVAAGGLSYAAEVGAEVIQVFVSNPRGWAAGPGDAAEDARLRASEVPVFVHATYMVNLGSGNPDVAAKSADAVAHALRRGGEIGARGVVVHTGSAAGWVTEDARERALRQIGEIALPLLDKLGDDDPDLLFEPMAGQGQMLCARAGDLAAYLSAVEHHPKAGVCLDTCHMFAAGHDLTADGGVAAMLGELGTVSGTAGPGSADGYRGRPREAGARQRLAARLRRQARQARDDRRGHDREGAVPRAARGPARRPLCRRDARR